MTNDNKPNNLVKILVTEIFKKNFKILLKKYPSINKDLLAIVDDLKKNSNLGISLGHNCFKIRLKITSKNKGKSAGARLITFYKNENNEVYLLTIYDKSNKVSITSNEIDDIISKI